MTWATEFTAFLHRQTVKSIDGLPNCWIRSVEEFFKLSEVEGNQGFDLRPTHAFIFDASCQYHRMIAMKCAELEQLQHTRSATQLPVMPVARVVADLADIFMSQFLKTSQVPTLRAFLSVFVLDKGAPSQKNATLAKRSSDKKRKGVEPYSGLDFSEDQETGEITVSFNVVTQADVDCVNSNGLFGLIRSA